jgi:hypothetical protein
MTRYCAPLHWAALLLLLLPLCSPVAPAPAAAVAMAARMKADEQRATTIAAMVNISPQRQSENNTHARLSTEELVERALEPWIATGVTPSQLAAASAVTSGRGAGKFQEVVARAAKQHADLVPNVDALPLFNMGASDWPEFPRREWRNPNSSKPCGGDGNGGGPPVLCPQNNGHFSCLMLPTFTRNQFGRGFEKTRSHLLAMGRSNHSRLDRVFWRGSLGCAIGCGARGDLYFPHNFLPPTVACVDDHRGWNPNVHGRNWGCEIKTGKWRQHERVKLVELSRREFAKCGVAAGRERGGGVLDARFTKFNEHKRFVEAQVGSGTAHSWLAPHVPEDQLASYRYAVHVGNNGFADRLWRLLALGLVVFKVENGWKEFYYDQLVPWQDYIPVSPLLDDLCERVSYVRSRPELALAVSRNAAAFVEERLRLEDIDRYTAMLINRYGMLVEKGRRGNTSKHREERDLGEVQIQPSH